MWRLSICIPVFNSDVRSLVEELSKQIDALNAKQINILLIDDASKPYFKQLNVFNNKLVQSIELNENIGRAKIRNVFLKFTDADFLLFIDGDSTVKDANFINKYSEFLTANPQTQVLVGASCYQNNLPPLSQRLRWKYSSKRESQSLKDRMKNQRHGFKSNNFVVARSILEKYPFEERLIGYGHEDTLFGIQLIQNNISIMQIENPVWNLHLDSNLIFLNKTDEALKNLLWMQDHLNHAGLIQSSSLLKQYLKLKKGLFSKLILWSLAWKAPILKMVLRSGLAPIFLFDLYRLGRLKKLDKNPSNRCS